MTEPLLSLRQVTKTFGEGAATVHALRGVDLDIRPGEFVAISGTSGSGKSTAMNILGCLDMPTTGEYRIEGVPVQQLPADVLAALRNARLGFVFQGFNLLPRTSARQNVELPLVYADVPTRVRVRRAREALTAVGLGDREDARSNQLSGGQQQRVALARSLAKGPKLLLLDEPMGALDKKLRSQMQLELVNIIEKLGVTCVMVTHDQEEAMTMATRIALMDAGRIRQVGTPDEIYEQPTSRFAAEFIGSLNVIEGVIEQDHADFVTIRSAALPDPVFVGHGISGFEGQQVVFALRPEKVRIGKDEPAQPHNKARGTIDDIAYYGSHSVYHLRLPSGAKLMAHFANRERWASDRFTWNDEVWVHWDDTAGVVLNA